MKQSTNTFSSKTAPTSMPKVCCIIGAGFQNVLSFGGKHHKAEPHQEASSQRGNTTVMFSGTETYLIGPSGSGKTAILRGVVLALEAILNPELCVDETERLLATRNNSYGYIILVLCPQSDASKHIKGKKPSSNAIVVTIRLPPRGEAPTVKAEEMSTTARKILQEWSKNPSKQACKCDVSESLRTWIKENVRYVPQDLGLSTICMQPTETLSAEEKNRCLQEERILKDRGFVVLHGERIRVGWAELLKLQNGTLFRLKGNEDFRKSWEEVCQLAEQNIGSEAKKSEAVLLKQKPSESSFEFQRMSGGHRDAGVVLLASCGVFTSDNTRQPPPQVLLLDEPGQNVGAFFRGKLADCLRRRTRNKKGEQQQQLIIATHHVELLNSNTVPIDCLQVRHGSALHRRQPTPATHISTLPRPITEMLGPKIMTKLRDPACLDMYFSRTVVLLEGKTDEIPVRCLLQQVADNERCQAKSKHLAEVAHFKIVSMQGWYGISHMRFVLSWLHIRCCSFRDFDSLFCSRNRYQRLSGHSFFSLNGTYLSLHAVYLMVLDCSRLIKDLESKRLEHFFRALEFGIQPPENKRAIHNCPSVEDLKQVKTLAKVIADHKLGKKHTPQFILIQFAVLFKAMVHSNSEWKKFKGLGVVQYFKTDEVQAHIDKRFKELMPHVGADITLRHQTYDKLGQHLQQAVEELLTLQFEFSKTQERKDKLRELSRRKDGVNEVKTYLVKNFTNALNTVSVDEIQVKLTELVQQSTQLPLTDPPPSTDELSEMLLVMIWKTYSTQKRKTLQHLLRRELERLQQAHGKLAQDTCLTLNAAKDTLPREQLDALRKSTTPLQPSHLGKLKPSLSRLCKAGWEHGHFVFPPDTADIEGIFINKSTNDDGKAPAPHPECLRSPDCLHGDEREILRKLGENELPRAQAIILNRMKAKISHLSIDVVKGQCESAKKETKLLADFMKTVMSTDEGSAGADGEHDTGGGEHHDDDDDEHHDEHHDDDDDDDDVACIPMSNPSRSRCYMNAVFQCLVRTTPLAQALKDSQDANTNQGALAHQVSNLMGDLTAYSSKDAINVKEKLSFRVGDYTEDKQQDAAEFLGDLLGALCIAPQVADAELCSKCGHTLSVSRSHTVKLSANDPQHPKQQLSLFQALQMQMLPADTVTSDCSKCAAKVATTRKPQMQSTTTWLLFHLNRFHYKDRRCHRIHNQVEIPLTLELTQEHIKGLSHGQVATFSLCGVVNHHGDSPTQGHYTATVLTHKGWMLCDDEKVEACSEINDASSADDPAQRCICSDKAYILFYVRKK